MAGLEAVLALRDLLGDRVEMTLVSPEREFVYRPMAVAAPFARGHAQRHRLADIASRLQVRLVADGLERVDDPSRSAITAAGDTLTYDALVVAVGAASEPAFARALTWTPESDADVYGGLLADLEAGYSKRVAFVVPDGVYWPLPAYELALMTAWDAYGMGQDDIEITVFTHERAPLDIFGPNASAALAKDLAEAHVGVQTGAHVTEATRGSSPTQAVRASTAGAWSPFRGRSATPCMGFTATRVASSRRTGSAACRVPRPCGRRGTLPRSPSSRAAWPPSRPTWSLARSPPGRERTSSRCRTVPSCAVSC